METGTIQLSCLVCETSLAIPNEVMKGEIVSCGACGQDHEILATEGKLEFALAPDVEEDWGE
jgi:alpha-aminoadipate carrier protein LysW